MSFAIQQTHKIGTNHIFRNQNNNDDSNTYFIFQCRALLFLFVVDFNGVNKKSFKTKIRNSS